ncbi:TRAP transporter large permease subunit [Elioraea tepida]|jgi:C4-dicarboxylate transporter DctM subunit|uniref:TRAP transporter large permease protein n=1 Tax=Elioraea tepida TaxID=2843330 RepID=A0A975U208_9PROT|nr:TRAP transporter large permease subunit [Elioraea tepida]QXM24477.1 TRAP transporter large permease subunit [Elioraea tepida]
MTFFATLAGLLVLLYLGVPMFAAMTLLSLGVLWGTEGTIATLGEFVFGKLDSYLLVAVPLFMLMAEFMVRGRVVDDLFHTAHTLLRHIRGGIGVATVAACTVFAAISGSSVATALTIGKVAIPQMLRYGYSRRGAFGVVAGGGTLGILIPPSAPMVLYAYVTEASVGALFAAGVLPGLMMAAMFALWCVVTEGRPVAVEGDDAGRPLTRAPAREMWAALKRSIWALTLPPFVLGGIYFGIFTPTEAAGTGALWALVIAALVYRRMTLRALWESLSEATRTTAMLFMIIVGASLYGYMLTKLRAPQELTQLVVELGLGRAGFLLAMAVLLFLLGLILESFSIILLTTPAILPVLDALAIDKVWYGVLLTLNLELALISPPVALNLVVIKAITGAPLSEVNLAAIPYMAMLAAGIVLIIAVPEIALWLPRVAGY